LNIEAQISMQAPVCGGNFPLQVIGWSILTKKMGDEVGCGIARAQSTTQKRDT